MLKRALGVFILCFLPWLTASAADFYMEGAQYARIHPAVPTDVDKGKVEVVELFWYGCPHCYAFEPYLKEWLKNMPEQAQFKRVPAVLNPTWKLHAQTYYALQLMGLTDELHSKIFEAMHAQHRRLNSLDAMSRFLVQQGVDDAKFRATINSLPVQADVNMAAELGRRYQADGVPTVIVNGKYRVTASMAGGHDEMIKVINYLIAQEAARTQAASNTP